MNRIWLWLHINFFATGVFLFFKLRHIRRLDLQSQILGFAYYDLLAFALLSFITLVGLKKLKLFTPLIFIATLINIYFLSKMGHPITQSLLSQVGDLLVIQTSIQSPSIYKAALSVIGATFIFCILLYVKLLQKKRFFSLPIAFLLIAIFMVSHWQNRKIATSKRHLSYNLFQSLLSPPKDVSGLIDFFAEKFPDHKLSPKPQPQSLQYTKVKPQKNIVLIVVETLSSVALKNSFDQIMPFLSKLKEVSHIYTDHYTPWPFSSKSLYALMCSRYPHPSTIIEMRVDGKKDCQGWLGELIKKHNYKSYVGYTGHLNYDNMGPFFKSQKFSTIRGQTYYKKQKDYERTDLSVDDISMVEDFSKWLKQDVKNKSFLSVFITMNSHFPFWSPSHFKSDEADPYLKSISYQDEIIKKVYQSLEETNTLQNTIIIITGDHGRRMESESSSMNAQELFKVPLIVVHPKKIGKAIGYPTVHNQVGQAALGWISDSESMAPIEKKPIFIYSDFGHLTISQITDQKITTFNSLDQNVYNKQSWKRSDEVCTDNCKKYFLPFYDFLWKTLSAYDF